MPNKTYMDAIRDDLYSELQSILSKLMSKAHEADSIEELHELNKTMSQVRKTWIVYRKSIGMVE